MMRREEVTMATLWILKGDREAPGWQELRKLAMSGELDVVHLDPQVWAVVRADEPPEGYEGITASVPPDGLYIDPNGSPMYLVDREIVSSAREVIAALGEEAESLLERIGDPDTVLERMGRAY
jgi:hypothetical protein